jgi:hypothetical protein
VSDLPTGPIPVVGHRHRRRGRRAAWFVLAAVLVVAVAAGGVALALRTGSSIGGIALPTPEESTPAPLLPGAPTVVVPAPAAPVTITGVGYDVSYPQCGAALPTGAAFGIVGVNGGAPLLSNKCFAEQMAWARTTPARAVYVNTAYSGAGDPVAYGRKLIDDAIAREHASGAGPTSMWWLDVELTNTWRGTQQENATVLASMAARLQELGARVGIYSSPQQWTEIAGDWQPGLPVWNATGPGRRAQAQAACSESFAGSTTAIAQWVQKTDGRVLDHNIVCPDWKTRGGDLFDVTQR